MIIPSYIKTGDKIRIVAPAGKLKKERLMPAVDWLKKQGYKVELGKHIFSQHFQYAGTDNERLEDMQTALDDPECKGIMCARGGYGTVRLIERLDFSEFKKHPKWLVGYSDITILHLALNKLGYATIHGTMPPFFFDEIGNPNDNLTSLLNLISGEKIDYKFETKSGNIPGKTNRELIGGNLSIITSLLGTKYEIETENKILFIEDINEYLYHIDRMIFQLKLAGKLEKLTGLVIGDFTDIKDNDEPFGKAVEELILDAVREYNYPVSFGLKSGHGNVNLALAFGCQWEFNVAQKFSRLNLQF